MGSFDQCATDQITEKTVYELVRKELVDIIKNKLQKGLTETLSAMISDLQTLRSEWASDRAATNVNFVSLNETCVRYESWHYESYHTVSYCYCG